MGLRFILGRAGTGKTHLCLHEMATRLNREGEDGPPLLMVVPEQATFQIERELLQKLHRGGTTRGQVLSFRRLAYRVLGEAGGAALPAISESGKRMVLRSILARNRQQLRVFGGSAAKPGFVRHLARAISEFRSHGLDPDSLTGVVQPDDESTLAGKIHDLALISREYGMGIAQRFSDPDGYLEMAATRFAGAQSWRGALVWIDGFATFTPVEYRLIQSLMLHAQDVTVALIMDGRRPVGKPPAETELFRDTHETYHHLTAMARQLGIPVTGVRVLDSDRPPHRFRRSPVLAYIEANFFTHPPSGAVPVEDIHEQIRLVSVADPAAEVEAVAAEITRLCRDQGWRPRDISIILRRLDPYEGWIRRIFADYGIPHFIDRRRPVLHHPLVKMLRSLLEIMHSDWEPGAVFRYLKTGLVPVEPDAVDRLENYVTAHGIAGAHWYDGRQWTFAFTPRHRGELEQINADRDQALAPVFELHQRLYREQASPAYFGRQLVEFLVDLGVPERLQKWQAAAQERGDLEQAMEHRQVWDGVMNLLDEICDAFGGETLSFAEYRQILEAGLQELDIGLIPPALDQVLVAAIDRSRQPNVKASFVLGANEDVFPAVVPEDPVFTDDDRESLAQSGIQLGDDSRRQLFRERFLAYVALTRPSHLLWVSYARSDGSGRELSPSPIVNRLKQLLPDLNEAVLPLGPVDPRSVEHPRRLAAGLLDQIRASRERAADPAPEWLAVYRWLRDHPQHGDYLRRLLPSLSEPRPFPPLSEATRHRLLGNWKFSPSRLETFAACPFMHFAAYDLRLQERVRPELDPARAGSLLHDALARITGKMMEPGAPAWEDLDQTAIASLVDEALDKFLPGLLRSIGVVTARHRYALEQLRETLLWIVEVMAEHARRSDFRPVAAELGFGGPGDALPALLIPLGDRALQLRGRIDRVDAAEVDGEQWVRVIDYKSSGRSVSLADIYYGLALQLPLYLAAVAQVGFGWPGDTFHPAGAYYLTLSKPLVAPPANGDAGGVVDGDLRKRRLSATKLTGISVNDPAVIQAMDRNIAGYSDLVNIGLGRTGSVYKSSPAAPEEDLKALAKFAQQVAAGIAGEILTGKVQPRPYRTPGGEVPCSYCAFRSVCRFEPAFGGHRDLAPVANDTIWQAARDAAEAAGGQAGGGA